MPRKPRRQRARYLIAGSRKTPSPVRFVQPTDSLESRRLLSAAAAAPSPNLVWLDPGGDLAVNATPADDRLVIAASGDSSITVTLNGAAQTFPLLSSASVIVDDNTGYDHITLDYSGGAALDGRKFVFSGDTPGVNTLLMFNSAATVAPHQGEIDITAGVYDVVSDLNGMDLHVSNSASASLSATQHFGSLTISDLAQVSVPDGVSAIVRTNGLSIAPGASLDLNNNDLVVEATPDTRAAALRDITNWVKDANHPQPSPSWGRLTAGAASSAAATTGLVVEGNATPTGAAVYTTLDGQSVDTNSILVKYTWAGDINLDGVVNFDDYLRINTGFLSNGALSGYENGDLNLDGVINFDDYYLINTAFLSQKVVLGAGAPRLWDNTISRYEQYDRVNPPPGDPVLFVGSSSFAIWGAQLTTDFAPLPAVNRGFGGSTYDSLLQYMDRVVIPYDPSGIVVYEGDNDIASHQSPQHILDDLTIFVNRVHQALPNTKIFVMSIKPSIARWSAWPLMSQANAMVSAYAQRTPNVFYIDVASAMLGPDGTPDPSLYLPDGLHPSRAGYLLWIPIIEAALAAH